MRQKRYLLTRGNVLLLKGIGVLCAGAAFWATTRLMVIGAKEEGMPHWAFVALELELDQASGCSTAIHTSGGSHFIEEVRVTVDHFEQVEQGQRRFGLAFPGA